jgi:hypothetical protein
MGLRVMVSRTLTIVNERPPKKRRPSPAGGGISRDSAMRGGRRLVLPRPPLMAILPHLFPGPRYCDRRPQRAERCQATNGVKSPKFCPTDQL